MENERPMHHIGYRASSSRRAHYGLRSRTSARGQTRQRTGVEKVVMEMDNIGMVKRVEGMETI